MKRKLSTAAISVVVAFSLLFTACGDPGREFVKNTDRVAGYVGTGLTMVNRLEGDGSISTAAALKATQALNQVNIANRELIQVAKSYKVTDAAGNTKIVLPEEGSARLLAILDSSTNTINTLISNPDFTNINPNTRKQIVDLLNSLNATLKSLVDLVAAAKKK